MQNGLLKNVISAEVAESENKRGYPLSYRVDVKEEWSPKCQFVRFMLASTVCYVGTCSGGSFLVWLVKGFFSSPWEMLRFSPYADIGSYLFIHGNVASLALNYIGWVSLVQCSNCPRSYT